MESKTALDKGHSGIIKAVAVRALDQGIATLLLLVVFGMLAAGIHYYGWPVAQVHINNAKASREDMSKFLEAHVEISKSQSEALDKMNELTQALVNAAEINRGFQFKVEQTHVDQEEVQKNILKVLESSQKQMAVVPELRREQNNLLREISDGIQACVNLKRGPNDD